VSEKARLYKKIAATQKQLHYIKKDGRFKSPKANYNFAQEADVMMAIRDALLDNGLTVLTSWSERGSEIVDNGRYRVETAMINGQIIDQDTGESVSVSYPATGADYGTGDKAVWKMITGGTKYFLLKTFLVPTFDRDIDTTKPGKDDPEYMSDEDHAKAEADKKLLEGLNKRLKSLGADVQSSVKELQAIGKMSRNRLVEICTANEWDDVRIMAKLEEICMESPKVTSTK